MTVTSCSALSSAPVRAGAAGHQAAPGHQARPGGQARPGRPDRRARVRMLAIRNSLAACERQIERGPRRVPALAIVGASYTAGVGPDNPALSWAAVLAAKLRWDAVIYGVPGTGYERTGTDDLGPMARMLGVEGLPGLSPALVIIQAGYDDGRVPAVVEREQVRRTIELIEAEAPDARIGLVTVFTGPSRPIPARFYRTDRTIVAAAMAVDPDAIIMDPLTGNWKFQHADDGLHPTAAGDAWIARKVDAILRAHGILSRPATAADDPISCDLGVRATAADGGTGT